MSTVTKKHLIDRIAKNTRVNHMLVKAIIQNFLDEVISELTKDNRLEFRDFGIFESHYRAQRMAQNPKTLEQVYVPAKQTVKFKMGQLMRQKLNRQNE